MSQKGKIYYNIITMKEEILRVIDIKKAYKEVKALNGVTFSINKGELFSLLGINGAGKSTLINIIASVIERDSGRIIVDGMDFDDSRIKIKSEISIVFQESVLDHRLSVIDNLLYRASLYHIKKKEFLKRYELLDKMLDLKSIEKRIYGKLSGGQRRRVDLARGLINNPKLLILDEPTTGLDPLSRKRIWKVIKDFQKNNNMSVFLTTHYMEEADESDNVVIIDQGRIIDQGTPSHLKDKYSGIYIKMYVDYSDLIAEKLNELKLKFNYDTNFYRIKFKTMNEVNEFLNKKYDFCSDFEIIKGNMDDVFINATGKKLVI